MVCWLSQAAMQGSHMPPALSNRSLIVGLPLQQCSKCFSSSSVLVSRQAVQLPLLHHRCPCLTAHGCLSAPFQPACFQLSATVRSCAARCALMLFLVTLAACAIWRPKALSNRCICPRERGASGRLLLPAARRRKKLRPTDLLWSSSSTLVLATGVQV